MQTGQISDRPIRQIFSDNCHKIGSERARRILTCKSIASKLKQSTRCGRKGENILSRLFRLHGRLCHSIQKNQKGQLGIQRQQECVGQNPGEKVHTNENLTHGKPSIVQQRSPRTRLSCCKRRSGIIRQLDCQIEDHQPLIVMYTCGWEFLPSHHCNHRYPWK
jgi:hypothetical protein